MTRETPQDNNNPGDAGLISQRHLKVAWIATALTLATYFILMLAVALTPSVLTQTVTAESTISIGIIAGVAIILFLIFVSAVFTIWNNKLDDSK